MAGDRCECPNVAASLAVPGQCARCGRALPERLRAPATPRAPGTRRRKVETGYTVPTCVRCNAEFQPRDEDNPGDLCDPCAHDEVASLRARCEALEGALHRMWRWTQSVGDHGTDCALTKPPPRPADAVCTCGLWDVEQAAEEALGDALASREGTSDGAD